MELGIFPDIPDVPMKKEFDNKIEDEGTHGGHCDESNDCVTHDSDGLLVTLLNTQRQQSEVMMEESKGLLRQTQPIIKMEIFRDNNYILAETEAENEDSKVQVQGQLLQQRLLPRPNKTVVERDEKGLKISSSSRYCIYCRFECSSPDAFSKAREKMDIHLARFHSEHFFPGVKDQVSGFKAKQFQRILVDFLFPQFIRKVGAYRACTLCTARYDSLRWYDNDIFMRSHLASKHETELRHRLSHILVDEAVEKKLESCKPEGAWCRCGIYITSPYLQKMHRRVYCNLNGSKGKKQKSSESQKDNVARPSKKAKKSGRETEFGIFPDMPDARIKTEVESNDKGTCFARTDSLDADNIFEFKHENDAADGLVTTSEMQRVAAVNGHYRSKSGVKVVGENQDPLGTQPVIKMEVFPASSYHDGVGEDSTNQVDAQDPLECHDPLECENEVDSGSSYMANFRPVTAKQKLYCKLCSTIVYREDAFQHWNRYCPKGMCLSTNSKDIHHPSSTIKSKSANDHGTEAAKAKEADEMYSLSCDYCRYVCHADISGFKKREELQLHQLRYHLEHFFREEKEQLSGEKRKQFQRILVGFLFPRFIQKIRDFRSCSLCGEARYQNSCWHYTYVYVRRHLIMQHKNELKARLKIILEDERLEEKLISSRKAEAWCPCGIYLPKGMEMHKARYCNLTAPNK